MDLTHSGWSDIFFLGMDYPEGAKVLNVSIDLGVHGRDAAPRPPVEAYLRVIEETGAALGQRRSRRDVPTSQIWPTFLISRKITLGCLKAAVIAAGIVPPGIEGSGHSLADLLARLVGPGQRTRNRQQRQQHPERFAPGRLHQFAGGADQRLHARDGQAASLTGPLEEHERRLVLARAILGEWLGGSGGGWQDSGGVWPGMKLIEGVPAGEPIRNSASAAAGSCRSIVFSNERTRRPRRAQACRTAWCWCMAAWLKTSARSSRW